MTHGHPDEFVPGCASCDALAGGVLVPCGTYSAFQRHRRRREPVDDACRQAQADYMRDWRRRSGRTTHPFLLAYERVHAVVEHARRISPSERAVVYVADVERALGLDAPIPHKTGNDGSGS